MKGPRRIVCLTEEPTEMLYLLGEDRRIVGISAYTVRPPEAKQNHRVVSAFLSGHVPKIVELKPDLVIGFSDIQADLARALIAEGLNVWITNQRSLDEIMETMLTLSRIVDRQVEGERLIDGWRRALDQARKRAPATPPRVFFQEWDDPIITGIRWVSELLEVVGARDAFSRRDGAMAKDRIVSAEDVAEVEPEIWIGSWCGKPMDFEQVRGQPEWKRVPAIRHDAIYEVDSSIILQPGPALFLSGLPELERIIAEHRSRQTAD